MAKAISRRDLFERGLQLSVGGVVVGLAGTATAADKVCADLKKMDNDQAGLRKSLNYTEMSSDQSKTCAVCAFFQATADGCGTCMIFSGPTNAKGHCDSWAAKS